MKYFALGVMAMSLLPALARPVAWKNVDPEHYLGGRKASEGYLRGKVVLVARWGQDSPPCQTLMPRLEEIWKSFKAKQFVLLGGHGMGRGTAEEIKMFIEEKHLSYPIYEDAGLVTGEPEFDELPFLYIVDETGQVVYKGRDDRLATERLVIALTDMEAPKSAEMWEKYLDFETKVLPGRAYLRLKEFRKKFPAEGKKYDEVYKKLNADPEVQKLARLVAFAKMARDSDPKDKKSKGKVNRVKIQSAIQMYSPMKDSKNELVAQEAKNAIADLKWALQHFAI